MEKKPQKDNNFSKKVLEEEYKRRFAYIKSGKAALATKNFIEAATFFSKFLSVIGDIHSIDAYSLKPNMFNGPSRTLERFMISNVYWEMAKIFSLSPKMDKDLQKSLNQFATFTINQPYQFLNSEVIRKHIKKGKIPNGQQHFKACQKAIFVKSNKCFVATECFGVDHFRTNRLRHFKHLLIQNPIGLLFVEKYYKLSPMIIYASHRSPNFKYVLKIFLKFFSDFLTVNNSVIK